MIEPAIVVIAFNRVEPFKRLLKSLAKAQYPSNNITLHISIDASDNPEVEKAANEFDWTNGEKIVETKTENLGLLKHVLECGQLTEKYDSIIVLEDDLIVAPGFYQYAIFANDFYSNDDKIAGVSLFTYPIEENNFYPFQPIKDDSDVHFIQVASSWGQSWNKEQWSKFKSWLKENPQGKEEQLPAYILEWGNNSWKKLFINYLIDTDKYFAFPNASYSSNFEEEGTHSSGTGLFQVPMNMGISEPRLKKWKDSNSVYDVYFELIPDALQRMIPSFSTFDIEIDLYGKKPIDKLTREHLLTIRKGKTPIQTFGATMEPLIQNIVFEIDGSDILLIEKGNVAKNEEEDRFLQITESIVRLRQNSKIYSTNREQVTVVIPAKDEKLLQHTIDNLYKDRFHNVTILISCHPDLAKKFEAIEETIGCRIEWILSETDDLNELLRKGFESFTTDYVSWVQAGMEINLKKFEKVAKILSGMKQVNFLRGIEEEVKEGSYQTKNSAPWRLTPQLAYAHSKVSRDVSSELMVWRKSILNEISANLKADYSNLFIELLKATPLYVLVDQIGTGNGIKPIHHQSKLELRESLQEPQFKRNFIRRFTTSPYLYPGFYGNLPFIRFFYKEIGRFPLVIRYDFRNDSYYLSNY